MRAVRAIVICLCFLLFPVICFSGVSAPQTAKPDLVQPNIIDPAKPLLTLSQEAKWHQMVGRWYGAELTKAGGKVMWIAEKQVDGTYKVHFRLIDRSGKKMDKVEIGEWGISGDIYFTIYKGDLVGNEVVPVDPKNPYNRDAYRIIKLTSESCEYISADSGNKYRIKKVSDSFNFPE